MGDYEDCCANQSCNDSQNDSERYPPPFAVKDIGAIILSSRPATTGRWYSSITGKAPADCNRHCQAARAIAEALIRLTKIKVLPSRQSFSFFGWN